MHTGERRQFYDATGTFAPIRPAGGDDGPAAPGAAAAGAGGGDPQAAQTLRQRQQELRPLLREARELAEHTAHYYDRRYIRREKYRI